jgi:hypothetical protein
VGEMFLLTVHCLDTKYTPRYKGTKISSKKQEYAANYSGIFQQDNDHITLYVMGRHTDWNDRKTFMTKPFCEKPKPAVNFSLKYPTEICNPFLVYINKF